MPPITSYDAMRRAPANWLGHADSPRREPTSYVRYFTTVGIYVSATVVSFTTFGGAVRAVGGNVEQAAIVAVILGIPAGLAAAWKTVPKVVKHIDHDRPVLFWRTLARFELNRWRAAHPRDTARTVAAVIWALGVFIAADQTQHAVMAAACAVLAALALVALWARFEPHDRMWARRDIRFAHSTFEDPPQTMTITAPVPRSGP